MVKRERPLDRPEKPQETVIATKVSANKRECDNFDFLQTIALEIQKTFMGEMKYSFKSNECLKFVEGVKKYFFDTLEILGVEADLEYYIPDSEQKKQARAYLFNGIAEHVFSQITKKEYERALFRDVVDDVVYLMQQWRLIEDGNIIKKKAFFDYFIKRYGLMESRFRCCEKCGSALISGIGNCPNCFNNSLLAPVKLNPRVPKKGEAKIVGQDIQSILAQKNMLAKKLEGLGTQYDELLTRHEISETRNEEEIALLQAEIARLADVVKEKDDAIATLQSYIHDIPMSDQDITNKKILVIGDLRVGSQTLEEVCYELDISPDMIEVQDDYGKVKRFAAKVQKEGRYIGIVIGATPHKVKGLGNATSLVTYFKGDGFPFTVEAKTYTGELKITKVSLKNALEEVINHLISQGQDVRRMK